MNSQAIGLVFNSRYDGNKLTADGWFDAETCARVNQEIIDRLNEGRSLETSVGIFIQHGPAPENTGYESTVEEIIPDHISILLDSSGAFPVANGFGIEASPFADLHRYDFYQRALLETQK